MATPLRSGRGHMSVGDSTEEFISVHDLRRESLLICVVLWSSVKSFKKTAVRLVGGDREF